MIMQMDAYSKKEQIGTLFVWVGALEGGFGGGGPSGGSTPITKRAIPPPPKNSLLTVLCF
jgi:hypothetical protein